MNLWLISIFEQTPVDNVFSTRFLNIAEEAIKRNHSVSFFASTFKHNTKNQRFEVTTEVPLKPDYKMIFVKSMGYMSNIAPRRMFAHYRFGKDLVQELKRREKPDVIFMAFPPISMAYEVSRWASKEGIPVIIDIIDPWPDIFRAAMKRIPAKIQDAVLYPMSYRLKAVLERVYAVSAISNQYIDWAKQYCPAVKRTLCVYPAVQFAEMQAMLQKIGENVTRSAVQLRVIYAGSLASSYDIPTILEAAAILEQQYGDSIRFIIAGVGPQEHLVKDYQLRHTNLDYLGRLVKADLMKEYYLADIGLTQHVKGATQSVTYKLFDLLACGLPIMNSLESEMKDMILSNRVGFFNSPGDASQLAANIAALHEDRLLLAEFKHNALLYTKSAGDAETAYARTVDLIEEAAFAS